MISFERLAYEAETAANLDRATAQSGEKAEVAELLIQHYRADLRNAMLIRISAFGATDEYTEAVRGLARDLSIANAEASRLLWPATQLVLRSAESVDIGRLSCRQDNDESKDKSNCLLELPGVSGRFTR